MWGLWEAVETRKIVCIGKTGSTARLNLQSDERIQTPPRPTRPFKFVRLDLNFSVAPLSEQLLHRQIEFFFFHDSETLLF